MRARRGIFLLALMAVLAVQVAANPAWSSKTSRSKSKPKPVRVALEARYAQMREAYRVESPETVLGMRTKDFHVLTPSGQTWDAETSAQYVRAGFAQVETTLVLTFGLGTIEVQGDTAAAEIDQHWVRRQMKAGRLRLVDTRAHQRETWLRKGNRWLLWRIDQVVPGIWIVDGKRVDPSQPYDPDAPSHTSAHSSR